MQIDPHNLTPEQRRQLATVFRRELARRKGMEPLRRAAEDSLAEFMRQAWDWIDPNDLSWNWHLDGIAEHLEAVTFGQIRRYLCNAPPRTGKTALISICWPAWCWVQPPERWGYISGPKTSFLFSSHTQTLSEEIAGKFRQLVTSQWFTENWGNRLKITRDALVKIENSKGGYRIASSAGVVPTGRGAAVLVVDDPIRVDDANSEVVRNAINQWWTEGMTSRLNDKRRGVKVIQMQRVHADDLTGHIVNELQEDWCHQVIPMRWDERFAESRVTSIGWRDPRTEPGQLMWPERFPDDVLTSDERTMGPYATAGQHQQDPQPRGGGIIKRDWWQLWPALGYDENRFPDCSLVVTSVDTAYGEKDENSWNACTTLGIWHDLKDRPRVVLMDGWRMRGPLLGDRPEEWTALAKATLSRKERAKLEEGMGLTERILATCARRKTDVLLIEDKTRGADLAREVRRQLRPAQCAVHMIMPMVDKISRMHATVPFFADAMVYAPDREWADMVIDEVTNFPKAKWSDLSDTISQALTWLRDRGIIKMRVEADEDELERLRHKPQKGALYDV